MNFLKKNFPFGERYLIKIGSTTSRGWSGRNLIISNLEVNEANDKVVESSTWDDYDFIVKEGHVTSLFYKKGCKALVYVDSYGGYSRRRNGTIMFRRWDFEPIAEIIADREKHTAAFAVWGNGADGDAGRIGQWDICLMRRANDFIVTVVTSGHYDDRCAIKFPNSELLWFDSWGELEECYEMTVAE